MKKRILLSSIMLIFLINMISAASYTCSDGEPAIETTKSINTNSIELTNTLEIGLTDSYFSEIANRYAADLLIDAETFTLTYGNNITIDLKAREFNLSLSNISGTKANITINGDVETMEEGESKTIDGGIVFISVIDVSGNSVSGMVGETAIALSNNDSSKTITFNEASYIVKLTTASFNYATIEVVRCKNKSATLTEVEEAVEINETNISTSQSNDSNASTSNIINLSSGNVNETKDSELAEDSEPLKISYTLIFIILGIVIIFIVLYFLVKSLRNKREVSAANEIKEVQRDMST